MLNDVFGFTTKKATYGIGYKLTLTRNKDEAVTEKSPGIADVRNKSDHFHRYVPHYTPSIQQQDNLSKQMFSRTPTELRYIERSVFMKEVNNQNLWKFELGSQESMNIPIYNIIEIQQRDRQDSQKLKIDIFCLLPVASAQCTIGTEKYPDAGMILNYDGDDKSQGYGQIKECYKALTKDDILQLNITDGDFRSSNTRADDVGYSSYVFDI